MATEANDLSTQTVQVSIKLSLGGWPAITLPQLAKFIRGQDGAPDMIAIEQLPRDQYRALCGADKQETHIYGLAAADGARYATGGSAVLSLSAEPEPGKATPQGSGTGTTKALSAASWPPIA